MNIHVGLILDGNRRWARERGLKSFEGHKRGFENLKSVIRDALDLSINHLSLYCLSIENLNRTKFEVNYLFKLLEKGLGGMMKSDEVKEGRVICKILGRTELLPASCRRVINKLEARTGSNDGMTVNFCIAYDGQCEIVDAVKKIIEEGVAPEEVTRESFKKFLYSNSPECDLIIRTGMSDGARISGFMLWDASYSEFIFRKDYWPDYNKAMLIEDLNEYSIRKRRFGK